MVNPLVILGGLLLGGFALKPLFTEKPFKPPSPEEEREFKRIRADARAVRRWSDAHGAESWGYRKLVAALGQDPKFREWDRKRLDNAIDEDADL